MLFNSLQFLLFFVVVTLAYYSLPWRGRWVLLLLASCYFYMVFVPAYILILFATIAIDYAAGVWIEKAEGKNRRLLLIISLISNIGILAFFKYFGFFTLNFEALFEGLGLPNVAQGIDNLSLRLLNKVLVLFGQAPVASFRVSNTFLPIGLSFHTFQAMSYTIEVYRGTQKAERHFGIYALYVMFYPQLVAGPIERPQNVMWQYHSYFRYDFENLKAGLMQMAWGFFKKVVIADRLALVVDAAYNHVSEQNGLTLLVATLFFTFQIYCDFSGYSDIAIGAARVMGFTLMENFHTPYAARSISDFWRRWHISLSTWFRDYLYIPLGGNRVGLTRQFFNQFFVFMVSGLWHGAKWTFVIWGALHGFYQVSARIRDRWMQRNGIQPPENQRWYQALQVLSTFSLVMLTWVFFRANTLRDAFDVLAGIFSFSWADSITSPLNGSEMAFSVGLVGLMLAKEKFLFVIPTRNTAWFAGVFIALAALCYFFGVFTSNQFIYFQF
ncbi:MAG: MBOAT family protein [Sphingobacteriaceae bacterium]|nr:MBOAT family protein [Cytophagaceae bacterium]